MGERVSASVTCSFNDPAQVTGAQTRAELSVEVQDPNNTQQVQEALRDLLAQAKVAFEADLREQARGAAVKCVGTTATGVYASTDPRRALRPVADMGRGTGPATVAAARPATSTAATTSDGSTSSAAGYSWQRVRDKMAAQTAGMSSEEVLAYMRSGAYQKIIAEERARTDP